MNLGLTGQYTTDELVELGVTLVKDVMQDVLRRTASDPAYYLAGEEKSGKRLLTIDSVAEATVRDVLQRHKHSRFHNIRVVGEESLKPDSDTDLAEEKRTVLLVDAVDGTDLLERGLGNWCTAAVLYTPTNPPGQRIRGAFVATPPPHSHIYWASDAPNTTASKILWTSGNRSTPRDVAGPSTVVSLANASVCFYGQKVSNLLESAPIFRNCVRSGDEKRRLKTLPEFELLRVYNLGGIPMMVKLCDKTVSIANHIDAVVDVCGQQPHDVIPGAFIALKAGAVLKNLTGELITVNQLEALLLRPSHGRLKYVLACTAALCDELVKLVQTRLAPDAT